MGTPDDRRYPKRPILGVGAIIIDADRVLLVERGREPLRGYWSLPGGVLEVGEKLIDGMRRETLEETGLEVQPQFLVEIFERIMLDAAGVAEYHYAGSTTLPRMTGGSLAAGDDVSKVLWVDRSDLPQYRITEGTLPVIEKAFGML